MPSFLYFIRCSQYRHHQEQCNTLTLTVALLRHMSPIRFSMLFNKMEWRHMRLAGGATLVTTMMIYAIVLSFHSRAYIDTIRQWTRQQCSQTTCDYDSDCCKKFHCANKQCFLDGCSQYQGQCSHSNECCGAMTCVSRSCQL